MVIWIRWHFPPDTGFEILALAVWGRARYLSVTEAPHNTEIYTWMGKKHFCSFKPPRPGTELRTLAWTAAVLTTTLLPPTLTVQTVSVILFGLYLNLHLIRYDGDYIQRINPRNTLLKVLDIEGCIHGIRHSGFCPRWAVLGGLTQHSATPPFATVEKNTWKTKYFEWL